MQTEETQSQLGECDSLECGGSGVMGYSDGFSFDYKKDYTVYKEPFTKADYFTLVPRIILAAIFGCITLLFGEKDVSRAPIIWAEGADGKRD